MSRNVKSAMRKAIRMAIREEKRKIFERIYGCGISGSVVVDVWLRPNGKIEVARIRFLVDGVPSRRRILGNKNALPNYPPGCDNEYGC